MKICAKCGDLKSLEEFGKHAKQKDGLQRNCAECQREYFEKYRLENKDTERERARKWRSNNPGATSLRVSEFISKNPEKSKEYSETYRKAHPERRRAICAKYRKNNVEKEKAYRKIYASRNLDKLAAKSSFRRAVKLMATPGWANEVAIKEKYALALRVSEFAKVPYHVDHIVPLVSKIVCGLHWEGNLRVIPGLENQSKGNRHWPNMP